MIQAFGYSGHFRITQNFIRGANGSYIFFRGCSDYTVESIKGLESVDLVWFEEAQRMSRRSWELLLPTIRKEGSQIIYTFNPYQRTDPVYRAFVAEGGTHRGAALVLRINYDRNEFFPGSLEMERRNCEINEPERYAHIWLGEPDDGGDVRHVLPYSLLKICVDAWDRRGRGEEGAVFAGLDVADTGADKNALVGRKGSCIFHVETWGGLTTGMTARRADQFCTEHNAVWLGYDQGGPGAGVRSEMEVIGPDYAVAGINFGGEVAGGERRYTAGRKNKDFFAYRNAQMGWALRLRAENTERLMNGEAVDPEKCLFIAPDIPRLDSYLAEMTQPVRRDTPNGKLAIDKQPVPEGGGGRPPSPDRYDASILAFAYASRRGIRLD